MIEVLHLWFSPIRQVRYNKLHSVMPPLKVKFVRRIKGAGVCEEMTLFTCLFYYFEITERS